MMALRKVWPLSLHSDIIDMKAANPRGSRISYLAESDHSFLRSCRRLCQSSATWTHREGVRLPFPPERSISPSRGEKPESAGARRRSFDAGRNRFSSTSSCSPCLPSVPLSFPAFHPTGRASASSQRCTVHATKQATISIRSHRGSYPSFFWCLLTLGPHSPRTRYVHTDCIRHRKLRGRQVLHPTRRHTHEHDDSSSSHRRKDLPRALGIQAGAVARARRT